MNKRKSMIYPYDISSIHLIEYSDLIPTIEIIKAVAPNGWGYNLEDAGEKLGIKTNVLVTSDLKEAIIGIETVIITESILPLPESHILDVISEILDANKEIIILRKLTDNSYEKLKTYGDRVKIYKEERSMDINLDVIPQNYKVKDISKPVVLVIGTGERCNKFEIQLELRKIFLDAGFKVSQIGSKHFCDFYGFHPFPYFMYEINRSTTNKIINFNRYINFICNSEKTDVVILGVPGGIYPYDDVFHNDFGILNFMISNAVYPDFTVLSSLNVDYKEMFAKEIKESLKYKYQYGIDCIFISNTAINWIQTKSTDELSYMTIETSVMQRILKNEEFFNIYNEDSKKKFKRTILETLLGYADVETL